MLWWSVQPLFYSSFQSWDMFKDPAKEEREQCKPTGPQGAIERDHVKMKTAQHSSIHPSLQGLPAGSKWPVVWWRRSTHWSLIWVKPIHTQNPTPHPPQRGAAAVWYEGLTSSLSCARKRGSRCSMVLSLPRMVDSPMMTEASADLTCWFVSETSSYQHKQATQDPGTLMRYLTGVKSNANSSYNPDSMSH